MVGLARGGVTETVTDGATGVLVEDSTPEAFAEGIRRVMTLPLDPTHLREQSLRFSLTRFHDDMRTLIEEHTA